MNIWSFFSLFNVDVATVWVLRVIWIPIVAMVYLYWVRKPKLDEIDLNLSIISFYVFFMISYGWVTEQTFLDPLAFIFLQILAYRPRRPYLYLLLVIQILVYAFSVVNGGLLIFEPLIARFSPEVLTWAKNLDPTSFSIAWAARGTLGLIISSALLLFISLLRKPSLLQLVFRKKTKEVHKSK